MSPSRQQVERWFIRRGLPHFIEDYSASEDIFTRASPFLALVLFTQLFLLFDPEVSGWAQAGVYLLGMFIPRANSTGVFLGMATGLACLAAVWIGTEVPTWWFGAFAMLPTFVVGAVTSYLVPSPVPPTTTPE